MLLDTIHKPASSSFLKINCHVKSETVSMNFCTVSSKSICLALGMPLLPMHDFVTLCVGHSGKVVCRFTQIFQILTYFIIQYQMPHVFFLSTTKLSRKVLRYWEAGSSLTDKLSKDSNDHLKVWLLSLAILLSVVILEVTDSSCSFLRKCLP